VKGLMRRLAVLLPCLCVTLAFPGGALACVLNNQSSLVANGFAAIKNIDAPTSNGLASWAPFTFQRVYGQSSAIRFTENFNDLRKSLNRQSLSRPFLWKWGDGTRSIGASASHAYRHSGYYVINVYAFDPTRASKGGWFAFDRAKVRIVPSGEVWKDNLGQMALDGFSLVFTWGVRVLLTIGCIAVAYGFWEDRQHGRKQQRSAAGPSRSSGRQVES
jgi:hypothetical protein